VNSLLNLKMNAMLKNLLYGILLFGALFSCSTGDDDDVFATEDMIDWYEVKDKPGKVNQLLYDIYKNDKLTIFINDTISREETVDHFGNPLVNLELFDIGYYVFSTDSRVSIQVSSDSTAMLKALKAIREKVIPYLPERGDCRPHSILLLDSISRLYDFTKGKFLWAEIPMYQKSIKGISVGRVKQLPEMDDEEIDIWARRILGGKSASWIKENCEEYEEFEKKTNEGRSSGSYYNINVNYTTKDVPETYGFLEWYCKFDSEKKYKTPSLEDDMVEYIAYVYAYRGREEAFKEKYAEYNKVLEKFIMMKAMVEKYERAQGIQ
jgi:hypothetical protein